MISIAEKVNTGEFVWRTKDGQIPISLMRVEEKIGAIASCLVRCSNYSKQKEELDEKIEDVKSEIKHLNEKISERKDQINQLKNKQAKKQDAYDVLADIATIMQDHLEQHDGISIPSDTTVDELNKMKDEIINSYIKSV